MSDPGLKDVYVNKLLGNYSIAYKNDGFVSEIIAPVVDVLQESGKYFKFGFEAFFPENDERAVEAPANLIKWTKTEADYSTREHALAKNIGQRVLDNEDKPVRVRQRTIEYLKDKVLLNKEIRVRNMLLSASFSSTTLTGTDRWDDYVNSDPLGDISDAKETVRKAIRKRPNYIIIPPAVAEKLSNHPDIIELRKYTESGLLTNSSLPPVIKGLKVIEPDAGEVASETDTTPDDVWGKNCIIMYVNPSPGLDTINTITTFATRRGRVRSGYDVRAEAEWHEYSNIVGEEIVCSGGAYVYKNVIS